MSGPRMAPLALLAIGCAQWSLVPAGPRDVDDYRLATSIAWSEAEADGDSVWTVDGQRLQALRFLAPVEDGGSLFALEDDPPIFRTQMAPGEIADLVIDSLDRAGMERIELQGLRPAEFAATSGFALELSFSMPDGLEMRGLGAGAVIDEKLYLVFYSGTALHYYDRHLPDVRRILESIEISRGAR